MIFATYKILFLMVISAVILFFSSGSVYARSSYFGVTAGTPGYVNMHYYLTGSGMGVGFSGFVLPFLDDSDVKDAPDPTEDKFGSIQMSFPIFLYKRGINFAALAPVFGGAYLAPSTENIGYWYYAGGSVQICVKGVFMEAGIGYGPRDNFTGIDLWRKTTMLFNIGYFIDAYQL